MESSLNLPINSVSFGQISTVLLRELYSRNINLPICPIGQNLDLSTQNVDQGFIDYLTKNINPFYSKHSRKNNIFRLWHINGSMESLSEKQIIYLRKVVELLKLSWKKPEDLQQELYEESKKLNIKTNKAFKAIYISLLDKSYGPKAAWLLLSNKELIIKRLQKAITKNN